MLLSSGRVLLMGVVATATMDILGALARAAHVMRPLPPALMGRWFAAVARGQPRQSNIAHAAPIDHELAIALLTHYVVGIAFAALYMSATLRFGVSPRRLAPALIFGLVTCAAPWLLMFPGMGFGLFGARGPAGTQLFLSSLISHITFGIGIWLGARVTGAA
jgi:Protein of unknown function (DUF2938)